MMAAPYNRPMTAPAQRASGCRQAGSGYNKCRTVRSGRQQRQSTPAVENITVRIDGMRFDPENITVKPGTTVTWLHGSQMPHTVSGNADGLRSGTLYKGQQFSHTFNTTGSYSYFCGLHPSMTGSVVVEEMGTDS